MGNVFSIAPSSDFLSTLVERLLDGSLIDGFNPKAQPVLLSDATIYVPNRRAARALSSAFLTHFNGNATILPRIRTLGDTDEDEFGISPDGTELVDLPEAIGSLDRTLQLATLVQKWKDRLTFNIQELFGDETILIPTSAADSIRLADDLANLLTQITQEETDWDEVNKLVPEDYADWWRLTSGFLKIIMNYWPDYLEEQNLLDPAERAVKLLRMRAEKYKTQPPNGPVIVAGTTGSVPSTQLLLEAVSKLQNGAIILPGVDLDMAEEAWGRLQKAQLSLDPLIESHPQFGLARTLNFLKVDRSNVQALDAPSKTAALRSKLVGTALSLSDLSADWHSEIETIKAEDLTAAFEDVALIEAANERQEALAIAIALRETLTNETASAALVTPDRNLAQRVSMELLRFNIKVDDSAGIALANTEVGIFLRSLVRIAQKKPGHPDIVSFLKNPQCLAGVPFAQSQAFGQQFEKVFLRGSIHTPETGKYADFANKRKHDLLANPRTAAQIEALEESWADFHGWLQNIDNILLPLSMECETENPAALVSLLQLLREAAIAVSINDEGISTLATARGASELDAFLRELLTSRATHYTLIPTELPDVLDTLLASRICRTGGNTHPRLHIYGPLEVRLLQHDRVVLAGLNEDTWPQNNRSDAFLNRTLRRELNMPSPERRTGLAAHDFQQLTGTKEVIFSRAGRVDKAPTVASRWLQRLGALLGENLTREMRDRGNRFTAYANALDAPAERGTRVTRPNEKPPLESRPKGLPVTDVETWIRDPYALYAKRILKLKPVEPLEREPDALLKGILYHAILEAYVETDGPDKPASERLGFMMEIASEKISDQNLPSDVDTIWKLRFEEIAKAYIEWELAYQGNHRLQKVLTEVDGRIVIGEGGFTLSARADRIDVLNEREINLFDYKTGGSPSKDQARTLSPQLALEALIAERGGFEDLPATNVIDMKYLRLRAGTKVGEEEIADKKNPISEIVNRAADNIEELVAAYSLEEQGYISRYAPFKDSEMSGDYDHLARVREWSFGEEDGDE